jgi:hypothetical protein
MQFEKHRLQQGSDVITHAVWNPATALQQSNSHRIHAVWYPATALQMTEEHLNAV